MNWLIETALANAAVATVLAGLALIVSGCARRPALTHALWVLVLVKLVTPPLVHVPVRVPVQAPADDLSSVVSEPSEPASVSTGDFEASAGREPAEIFERPDRAPRGARAPRSPGGRAVVSPDRPKADEPVPATTAPPAPRLDSALVFRTLLLIWILGSVAVAATIAWRLLRFLRSLREASPAARHLQDRADELARSMGLGRTPTVLMVDWVCSPMLWSCGRRARLLFPAALWHALDEKARDALVVHELAHYRRGDHHVRLLELAVTVLYWWHPVVWWARRAIAVAGEECCDAWVVEQLDQSPRSYADALLTTLDFIAEHRPVLPPVATGVRDLPVLKRRLTCIMRRSVRRSLSRHARWSLIVCSAGVLPLHPVAIPMAAPDADASLSPAGWLGLSPRSPSPNVVNDPRAGASKTQPQPPDGLAPGRAQERSRGGGDPADSPAAALAAAAGREETLAPVPTGWWTARPSERWATARAPHGGFRLVAETGYRVRLERLWDGRQFDLSAARLTSAAFTPDGRRFVAGTADGSVRIWDAESAEAVSLLGRHDAEVRSVAVSPDGRAAASGSRDGTLVIWDMASGAVRATWTTQPQRPITSVRFSPDGALLAVAAGDWRTPDSHRITLLDALTWETRSSLAAGSPVAALEFTSDGILLSADRTGRVLRWNVPTARAVLWARVEKEAVESATFSPDSRLWDPSRT